MRSCVARPTRAFQFVLAMVIVFSPTTVHLTKDGARVAWIIIGTSPHRARPLLLLVVHVGRFFSGSIAVGPVCSLMDMAMPW